MIKSMTGYGRSSLEIDKRSYTVEIRSVNHRFLDTSVKIPKKLNFLEEEIKKIISQKVNRGKVDVYITYEDNSSDSIKVKINEELAKEYINKLKEIAKKENISSEININEVVKYPDIITIESNQDEEIIKKELLPVVSEAVNNLVEMRQEEGRKLSEDLKERINVIEPKIKQISSLSTGLINQYVVKLKARIKQLLQEQEIDEYRIAQEVVIYADKCSIEEEVTRLYSHIAQFEKMLNDNIAVGKKLDFIVQEMNRETNTIGSKANNLEISNEVIEIKTEIENIREQVQNIE